MADSADFMLEQQKAIERMKEMSRRSENRNLHNMPPVPPFVKLDSEQQNINFPQSDRYSSFPSRDGNKAQNNSRKSGSNYPHTARSANDSFLGLNIPFLDKIQTEPDISLIIGLLLLLWSEKADKKLLLALLYILF